MRKLIVPIFLLFIIILLPQKGFTFTNETNPIIIKNNDSVFFQLYEKGYSLEMIELVEKALNTDGRKKENIKYTFNFQKELKRIARRREEQKKLIHSIFEHLKLNQPREIIIKTVELSKSNKKAKKEISNGKN